MKTFEISHKHENWRRNEMKRKYFEEETNKQSLRNNDVVDDDQMAHSLWNVKNITNMTIQIVFTKQYFINAELSCRTAETRQ